MKKLLVIVLACSIFWIGAMPVAAVNVGSAVQPRFTYIDDISADLEVSFLGVARCDGTFNAWANDSPIKMVIRLQEYDGSNWVTIKKWEITGTGSIAAYRDYAIYSGSSYRAHVTGYVYDANGNLLETASKSAYIDY